MRDDPDPTLSLIVEIATTFRDALIELDATTCGAETVIVKKPWSIPVSCTLVNGHRAKKHSDGFSEWSD
jgi:hypothetical protein